MTRSPKKDVGHPMAKTPLVHALVAGAIGLAVSITGCAASGSTGRHASDALGPAAVTSPASRSTPHPHGPWRPVGDVDGDGKTDQARLRDLHRHEPGMPYREFYRLVVRRSSHGVSRTTFVGMRDPGAPAFAQTQVVGGTDISADGAAEVFVEDWHGASTAFVTIFRLVEGRLAQLTVGGMPVDLGVDGTVADLFGFACQAHGLTSWADGRTDSHHFREDTKRYHVEGSTLVLMSRDVARVRNSHAGPFVQCDGLPEDVGVPTG